MDSLRDAIRIWSTAFAIMVAAASGFLGCSTAGNGGAGAAGEVKGNVNDIHQRAQSVFKDMQIQLVHSDNKDSGHQQSIGGTSGDEDVVVAMTSSGPDTTHVEVTAKTGTFRWDKDYAHKILSRIVQG
jgi:hypothetical protein